MTALDVTRGDTLRYTVTLTDPDIPANPYNLSGCTLWWTLKEDRDRKDADDSDAIAALYWVSGGGASGIVVATPADGEPVITMTPTQTDGLDQDLYYWDLQLTDSAGDTWTSDSGTLKVRQDITRRRTTP